MNERTAFLVVRALRPDEPAPEGYVRSAEGTTLFVASEPVPDRYEDIVDASWLLDNYRRNPVVLYGHDWSAPPIGRAVQIEVRDQRLIAEVEFDTEDEDSARIAGKVERGFLNAVSVGFRPGRVIDRSQLPEEDPRHGEHGAVLFDNELLELSVVAVPALPSAEAIRSPDLLLAAVRDRAREEPAFLRSLEAVILAAPATDTTTTDEWWSTWRV